MSTRRPTARGGEYRETPTAPHGTRDGRDADRGRLFGMVGSIVVGSATKPGANPVGEAPAPSEQSRPPEFTAGLVLSDPAMAPENTVEQG